MSAHGSWIYNYLCNQCLSPLMLWVWIKAMCTTLCDTVCQLLATLGGFLQVLRSPLPITVNVRILLRYCWKWRRTPSNKQTNNPFVIFSPGFSIVCIVLFYIIYNCSAYLWNIIFLCIKKIVVLLQWRYHSGSTDNMTFFVFLVKIQWCAKIKRKAYFSTLVYGRNIYS